VTPLSFALPKIVACNITPRSVQVGTQTLYLLPDVMLVAHDQRVGAVGYADLELRWQDSNFIEEGRVPVDAEVVGQTWKHPNKGGGPDRRFKENYQIPICRYEVLHPSSGSGLNELLEFSKRGVSRPLADGVRDLAGLNGRLGVPEFLTTR
jgi:hypothetical protein